MRLKTMQKSVDEMRMSDPATDFNKSMLERLLSDGAVPFEKHGNRIVLDYDMLIRCLNDRLELDGNRPPHIRTIDHAVAEVKRDLPDLGVGEEKVRTLVALGKIPFIRIGNRTYLAMELFHAPYNRRLFEAAEKPQGERRHHRRSYADEMMDEIFKRGAETAKPKRA